MSGRKSHHSQPRPPPRSSRRRSPPRNTMPITSSMVVRGSFCKASTLWSNSGRGATLEVGPRRGAQRVIVKDVEGGERERLGGGQHRRNALVRRGLGGEGAVVTEGLAGGADAEVRMDGGRDVGDVAHVGGAGADGRVGVGVDDPERGQVGAEAARQRLVVAQVLVRLAAHELEAGPGRGGG